MRYVACKKKINEGGVIPCDVPHHLFHLVQEHEEWAGVKPRKGKKRSTDGLEIAEKIKKEENRGKESGEKRKNDERKMSSNAANPKEKETREEGRKEGNKPGNCNLWPRSRTRVPDNTSHIQLASCCRLKARKHEMLNLLVKLQVCHLLSVQLRVPHIFTFQKLTFCNATCYPQRLLILIL